MKNLNIDLEKIVIEPKKVANINLRLEIDLANDLKKICKKLKTTPSELIRELIKQAVEQNK